MNYFAYKNQKKNQDIKFFLPQFKIPKISL
jgi:hypothetical protein